MKELKDHTGRMNYYLRRFVLDAFKISLLNPERAWFLFETLIFQWLASRRRTKKNSKNCLIPPYMIISITGQCNLKCQGCYAQVHNAKRNGELTIPEWEKLLDEAGELGVSVALVAGGEPLSRPEFFDMLKTRKSMLFPVFTNGLLIDDPYIEKFRSQPNLIPVVSVEGLQDQTDGRRGEAPGIRSFQTNTVTGFLASNYRVYADAANGATLGRNVGHRPRTGGAAARQNAIICEHFNGTPCRPDGGHGR